MIKLDISLKRFTWTLFLFSILGLPYLLAQSDDIDNLKDNTGLVSEKPTDELIDISNVNIDQDLIYGPSPWTLPDKYKNLISSEYRRDFFRMTGIEYSGLHWKQFIMVYMNINPKVYVKNYYEYIRLYYSDDGDEDWGDEDETGNDDDEGWDETGNDDDEGWDETGNDDDDSWDETGNDDDEGWEEPQEDVDSEGSNSEFELFVPGTVLLKEHYKSENGQPGAPETITLMIKREKGYDPKAGDWEYSQFETNGKMLMEGNSQRSKIFQNCTECHANIKERDYIFTTYSSWLPIPEKND